MIHTDGWLMVILCMVIVGGCQGGPGSRPDNPPPDEPASMARDQGKGQTQEAEATHGEEHGHQAGAGDVGHSAEAGDQGREAGSASRDAYPQPSLDPRETHLANIRQLTFGGENAEAYFSFDGKRLSFQARTKEMGCDRIFTMSLDGSDVKPISSGEGASTCAYYTRDGEWIVYASTHLGGATCPPKPDMSEGYIWALYESYDIFKKNLITGEIVQLTATPGYDAEATISPDGQTIIFTSVRDGDIDLYTMDLDGKNVHRLTDAPGYDGGAFFSHDGRKIVWRASRPEGKVLKDFKSLLGRGLVRPSKLEIYVANSDGTNVKQLTENSKANFAPYFTPDDSGVLFASNMADPAGRIFDIFRVDLQGSKPERITYSKSFDGFPMFSPDGKSLAFSSNRNSLVRGETNVFMADWVE